MSRLVFRVAVLLLLVVLAEFLPAAPSPEWLVL